MAVTIVLRCSDTHYSSTLTITNTRTTKATLSFDYAVVVSDGTILVNNTETTTKKASTTKSSSSKSSTASIPKTGDVAIYAVAGVAVAAGLALVLTKKNKDSDEK